jgi:diaminobutyrate-2-oxoglutarate transaminase
MSLVLMKSTLDQWEPGQHNGTFRGNNLAFVSATAALELYWSELSFSREVHRKARTIRERLEVIADEVEDVELVPRGRGMIRALACPECPALAGLVSAEAYRRGLIIETCGTDDNVLKFLPPLTIEDEQLERGLDIVAESIHAVLSSQAARSELTISK